MKKRKTPTILWVDDDIKRLRVFVDEMQDEGYEIIQAETPEEMEAVLSRERQNIDLIIMDLMLPIGHRISPVKVNNGRLTGLFLIERIKENKALKKIPIILFTIISDSSVSNWCKNHNVKILRKADVLPSELCQHVLSILSNGIKET